MKKEIVKIKPSKDILCYVAGLFDGEGCIKICRVNAKSINRPNDRFTLDIQLQMTDENVVKWLWGTFGGYFYIHKTKNPKWKTSYRWILQYQRCKLFLQWIMPFLKTKKRLAKLALEYLEISKRDIEAKKGIYQLIKKMNH